MLRVCFLQQCYGLAGKALDDTIYGSRSRRSRTTLLVRKVTAA